MRKDSSAGYCAGVFLLAITLTACSPTSTGSLPGTNSRPSPSPSVSPTASAIDQDSIVGPGGMTLAQEIGAVMMVGFTGPLTPAVIEDWRQRQFGGLLLVPVNQNAADAAGVRQLISTVRGVMTHPLLAATNQEGGTVCFLPTTVPCLAGARQVGPRGPAAARAEMTTMSRALKALDFDINLAPVADVWDGVHPFMSDRSYGQDPALVAADVSAAIAGIHAAGMYAAAKHFPGHGTANGDSHVTLPLVSEPAQTLHDRDWVPFEAAIAAHVDFVLIAHLDVPALDANAPSSMSATVLQVLRSELGYQGVAISDDLEMGALSPGYPPPTAAVRFLENGGDMVIVSHDLAVADATYDAIHAAVQSGAYPRVHLDASVQKLLNLSQTFTP